MLKHKLVDFIIQFMEEVDKEISEMKLFVRIPDLARLLYLHLGISPSSQCKTLTISIAECTGKIRGRVFSDSGMLTYTSQRGLG